MQNVREKSLYDNIVHYKKKEVTLNNSYKRGK